MPRISTIRKQPLEENLIQDTGTVFLAMVNKEVAQFIRAYKNYQLVYSFSHEAQPLLQTVESDTKFDVVFIDFCEPRYIPYWDRYCKILT